VAQDSLVERVIFNLIKKHIAGPTMNAAISRAKLLNSKGIPASITFLASPPLNTAKATYITATYMQLIREIARLGITANVHVPMQQLGVHIGTETAFNNVKRILDVSTRAGVFVWFELGELEKEHEMLNGIKEKKGFGVALGGFDHGMRYAGKRSSMKDLKIICGKMGEAEKSDNKERRDMIKYIDSIMPKTNNLVLLSPNESVVTKLINKNGKYRKALIFEFQLGYGEKKIRSMLNKGARLSMYVPFGKDWVTYAITNVPEGYMRTIAGSLLKEGGEQRGV
jgi:proline dehydrogenase